MHISVSEGKLMRLAVAACMLTLIGSSLVPGRAGEFKLGDRALKVPAGFTIEPVAGPPLVDRPITAAFDEEGRLYIADSSGSNDNVQKQLAERPHRIVRLEVRDGDGRFDTRTIFADRMMFPEGTMWYGGSLYVSAPPSIWKLTDTDGDGVADQRVEWFQGKTLTGCANDLHGPYLGPDLTKVGEVRSERDLLEAIVYPSASLIRSYEPVVVATADGKVLNGLLRNETSDEILLVTGANQEARIPRADIEEIRPSSVSVMPAGLDQQLSTQELADLVAFLRACR